MNVVGSRWSPASWVVLALCAALAVTGDQERDRPVESRVWLHVKVAPSTLSVAQLRRIAGADPVHLFAHSAPVLDQWWRLRVPRRAAAALARRLEARPEILSAFVEPVVRPAYFAVRDSTAEKSCPVTTPSYQPYQGYLAEAPAGINAPAAWARSGGRGEGISVADVEGGWNRAHEDLPGDRMVHAGGRLMRDRGWIAHGTAVLGEIAARDNSIGMVGITPNVERIVTASIGRIGAAAAIELAQARLDPGDVLIVELHAIGPRGRFLPVEFWDDVYDVVKLAVGRGVVVVAAAGNGGENLDHRAYKGKLTRKKRDSGSILVGAGAPARDGFVDRSRLWFSNYGSRVDVQGWGLHVATLDYGDLQDCSAHDRKYTAEFGGTSSATPVVAGAALMLQGIARAQTGAPLAPAQVRHILSTTGSPQTSGPDAPASERIGPRPDMARALRALDQL